MIPASAIRRSPVRVALALHEAGHAVCAVLLGLEVDSVTIVPTAEAFGACWYHDAMPEDDDWERVAMSVAGEAAVMLFDPKLQAAYDAAAHSMIRPHGPPLPDNTLSDVDQVRKSLAKAARAGTTAARAFQPSRDQVAALQMIRQGTPPGSAWKTVHQRRTTPGVDLACTLLESSWLAVEIIAAELLDFGTLDGQRVVEVVAGTLDTGADQVRTRRAS